MSVYKAFIRFIRGALGLPKTKKEIMLTLLNEAKEEIDLNKVHALLISFWSVLDIHDIRVPPKRALLGIPLKLRHSNIETFLIDLEVINDLISNNDQAEMARYSKNKYSQQVKISFDGYFTTTAGMPLSVIAALYDLQAKLMYQRDILTTVDKGSQAWILSRFYHDLLTLSEALTIHLMGNE